MSRVTSFGAAAPADQHRADHQVRHRSRAPSMCSCVEYSVRSVAPKIRRQFAQALHGTIDDGDVRAAGQPPSPPHACRRRRRRGITTFGGPATPGTPRARSPQAPVRLLQAVRADLHRHSAGDFAHRRKQRAEPSGAGDRSRGDAVGARLDQRLGLFRIRREMQVRVEDLALAQLRALFRLRLLHLHDHLGPVEDLLGPSPRSLRRRAGIRIGEADAGRAAGLAP